MIVMVPFAEGNDGHQPGVAGAAFGRIRALAEVVAQRIDAKSAVLKDDDARHARDEKRAERRKPTTPAKAQDCGQHEGDQRADPMNIAMLPKDERILLQVGHVVERRERVEFEHQPADVSVKETFGDAIRIFIVIDMFVVSTMFAGPEEGRIFEGSCTENQREEPYRPVRLESEVGEEPMVTDRNGKSARGEHDKEKPDLEPINPEEVEVDGYRAKGEK